MKTVIPLLMLFLVLGCGSPKPEKAPSSSQREVSSNLKGSFSITGAYALYPLIVRLADEFMAIHKDVRIEVAKTGTGLGIADLLAGKCNLAMISRPLTDEEVNAGIWVIPVAKDGVAPIINNNNPYLGTILDRGLSQDEFLELFTSDKDVTWGRILDTTFVEKVNVYTRGDESGAADIWASFMYRSRADLKGTKVTGDDEMLSMVQRDKFAVGYCNLSYAFDPTTGERTKDIQVIPTDLDFDNRIERKEVPFKNLAEAHRSLWLGFYPHSLCRELTIGSLGKPTDPMIVEFLYFILGEGQAIIKNSGFCQLNNVYLKYSIDNLE